MKKNLHYILAAIGFIIYVLAFTIGAFGQTIPKVKSTFSTTTHVITFDDGVIVTIKGSNTISTRKAAYLSAVKPPVVTPPVIVKPPIENWVSVGNGSGYLTLGDISNKNIRIKAGSYTGVSVSKINNTVIDATGVTISGSFDIGTGTGLELYGLSVIHSNVGRAIKIQGLVKKLYLHDIYFRNVKDYTIASEAKTFYDGTDKTTLSDWTLEKLTFDNCNALFVGESNVDWNAGKIRNVYTGFKLINCKSNAGTANIINGVHSENFEVKGNVIDGMNSSNAVGGSHNRILAIGGNGKIYNNKITNHQGNAISIAPLSVFKDSGKDVQIYNNVVYNSYKYSAIDAKVSTETTDWNAKYPNSFFGVPLSVHNNTVGKMNTSKDWEGQILDLYNILGSLEYYNNLGFDLNRVQGSITDMINGNGDSVPPRLKPEEYMKTNKYFANWQDALENLTNFKSKINGIGAVQ